KKQTAVQVATPQPADLEQAAPPDLAPELVGDAILAGQLAAPPPDLDVPVIVGDGSVQLVRAGDLGAAMDQGWTVATGQQVQEFRAQQKYESGTAQAQAALEAGARGITLGLSDAGLSALGVNMDDVGQRQARNPTLSLGAEVVGAALPVLLSGGGAAPASGASVGGTLARGAAAGIRAAGVLPRAVEAAGAIAGRGARGLLGEGIVARAAGLGAQGAVEGGLYGIGQAVSESAIQDAPLTAERVLGHVGMGALFGGAGGTVLGVVAAAGERALAPLFKKVLTVENVERFVDEHGLRQWAQGRGKSLFKKLRKDFGDDAASSIGRTVKDEGLDHLMSEGATWQEMHAATQQKLKNAGKRIGETMQEIDAVAPGKASDASARIADRARKELIGTLERSGVASDKTLAKKITREFEWLWPAEKKAAGRAATDAEKRLAALERSADPADLAMAEHLRTRVADRAGAAREGFVPSFERLHQLRARIDDVAYPRGGADASPYQKALQNLRGIVEDELTTAADAAATAAGPNLASSYTAAKQRYRGLKWLNDAAENNAASDLANRQFSLTDTIVGSSIGGSTLMATLGGDVGALGSTVIATIAGAAAGLVNKQLRETGQRLVAKTGEKVLALMKASERMAKDTDDAVAKFFAKPAAASRVAGVATSEGLHEKYDTRRKQFEAYQLSPLAAMSTALGDTDQTAPAVAREVRATAARATEYLNSKMPARKTRDSDLYAHLDDRPRVADSQMAKFVRAYDAVSNPRAVLDDVAKGRLTRDGADALRVVYPQMHQQLVEQVQLHVAQSGRERLPYQKLVQLSILTGTPMHPSLEPRFIAACQSVHRKAREQAQEKQGVTPGNRKAPTGAKQLATASQELEATG
ncbi:MAG TPA: hypothetical protein VK509_01505, partial [Polyangiales bacterium]|nr:hypothetical protein [Polyangiales bacterium]